MTEGALTCRELIAFLDAYRNDELAADDRRHFDAHLGACPACVEYLARYEAAVAMAKNAANDPETPVGDDVPSELVHAILSRIRQS